jgi:hypothetical protein
MRARCLLLLGGSLVAGGCWSETVDDDAAAVAARPRPLDPPRLIAPMSSTHVTTKLPTLSWQLPDRAIGARVEICGDRACGDVLYTFEVEGESVVPDEQLPDGVMFWRVTALGRHGRTSAPSAVWQFWTSGMLFPQPGLDGPPVDTTYGSVLDVNGDGFADLAVGAPGGAAGLVHIYLGGAGGPPETPSQTLTGAAGYGATLASAGDVDGDGYADLAIATEGGSGGVEVRYGSANALGSRATVLDPHGVTASFGLTMAPSMDVEGDGYGDVIVSGREVAQVYRGGAGGIAATPAYELRGDDAIDPNVAPNAALLTGGGDVNGDRRPDAVVSGWSYLGTGSGFALETNTAFLAYEGNYLGDVSGDGRCDYAGYEVRLGTPTGLFAGFSWAEAGQYMFGAAGDTNGDGFNDYLADVSDLTGLPPWRAYYGNPLNGSDGPQNAITLPGGRPTLAGWTAAGDLNGDTLEDVAVGVPADGAVYLFMAPDVPETPTRTLTGPGERFGAAVE